MNESNLEDMEIIEGRPGQNPRPGQIILDHNGGQPLGPATFNEARPTFLPLFQSLLRYAQVLEADNQEALGQDLTYWVVIIGREPGLYRTAVEAQAQISNIRNGLFLASKLTAVEKEKIAKLTNDPQETIDGRTRSHVGKLQYLWAILETRYTVRAPQLPQASWSSRVESRQRNTIQRLEAILHLMQNLGGLLQTTINLIPPQQDTRQVETLHHELGQWTTEVHQEYIKVLEEFSEHETSNNR